MKKVEFTCDRCEAKMVGNYDHIPKTPDGWVEMKFGLSHFDLCPACLTPKWQPLLRVIDRLQEATIEKDGRIVTTRTQVTGQVGNVFKAAGIALPHNLDEQLA